MLVTHEVSQQYAPKWLNILGLCLINSNQILSHLSLSLSHPTPQTNVACFVQTFLLLRWGRIKYWIGVQPPWEEAQSCVLFSLVIMFNIQILHGLQVF
jgi:hypothetical protein